MIDPAASLTLVQRQLAALFTDFGSDAAMVEARILICAALNIDHAQFVRDSEQPIGAAGAALLEGMAARRIKHEPVSRILGHRAFFGLDFCVSPAVLDPRPDTETVVEAALDAMAARRDAPLRILDLGTGSGALLCALLSHLPKAFGIGVDLSEAACRIAHKNLAALGLASRGSIVCGEWMKALAGRFDVIVSNPPYIVHGEIAGLAPEVRDFDPALALDGGTDGYNAYRAIIPMLPKFLARNGVAVLELGKGQAARVAMLFEAAGLFSITTRRDLAGIERAISVRVAD
ncbi:MAG: peptide chain release factor N(5)-glutamine methyltransferase [Methylovirgula sp.]